MNREYAYDPNYANRTTPASNLSYEDQLKVMFANRGLGALNVNAVRSAAMQQRPAQPMQQRPVQPMQQRPAQPMQQRGMQQACPQRVQPAPQAKQSVRSGYYEARTTRVPFPVAALVALLVCTLTVLSLVMGAAMVSRASDEVSDLKSEAAELAGIERELVQALDRKNDLRTIERIAVDELGMISTDLITKKFISFGGIDVIEAYEDEENEAIGLSTLLAAIGIGVE